MKFMCEHCGKIINCAPIIVDNHFLHTNCEEDFKKEKEIKEQLTNENGKLFS